ncbi:Nascent polypeptide-associated complex subunit beta [Wickerhamomyces ciferrii]|uniref:Nascent polypeptide-associated complex subunit beta n=1 Tax=Wickerhamomyces ciferrii (strain ATCC 14091 / BCRC 22168 / CBS 111 / JCM 3599 / NBRC 0793 / NRRL Y-1031 F-60-10) TaxID=1206466 RepID=K0KHZ7_WICCF|nr:Nascent polypeptide-associated complex subunit beta [Wickerhamomyces ciferrii]CCH41034.1 Nascent polypeptide-associated complex subunit beta [Wickerhamomyces ciferrii]
MPIDQEKLAKLQKQSNNKVGGIRRKAKKPAQKPSADDSKLQATLQKLNVQTLDNVEEANFFRDDGKVLHFNRVGVQSANQHNVHGFYGIPQEKEITELIPNIIPQLGAENLDILSKLAAQLQQQKGAGAEGQAAAGDDEIPDLVEGENFESQVE